MLMTVYDLLELFQCLPPFCMCRKSCNHSNLWQLIDCRAIVHRKSENKPVHLMFCHNFGKCEPIYKILSPWYSWRNVLCKWRLSSHSPWNVLLHYLVKIIDWKMLAMQVKPRGLWWPWVSLKIDIHYWKLLDDQYCKMLHMLCINYITEVMSCLASLSYIGFKKCQGHLKSQLLPIYFYS